MSWLYSRALVEEYLAEACLAGEPSAPSSATPTPLAYCAPDKMMAFSRLSRFGTTFALLTGDRGDAVLMSFLADFPAKTSAPQARVLELTASKAASGEKWRELSVRFDLTSSSWKTARCLFDEDLPWSSVTLPRWGTMRNGECWERITPELITNEIESGYWLPTPTATANMLAPSMQKWPCHQEFCKEVGGSLNPAWVEWLMGWPIGWTDLEPLEMDKFQSWLQTHLSCFDE